MRVHLMLLAELLLDGGVFELQPSPWQLPQQRMRSRYIAAESTQACSRVDSGLITNSTSLASALHQQMYSAIMIPQHQQLRGQYRQHWPTLNQRHHPVTYTPPAGP